MSNQKFKIFAFSFPASGHFNPMVPILEELNSHESIEVFFYQIESYKNKIESYGLKYKPIKNFDMESLWKDAKTEESRQKRDFAKFIRFFIDSADSNLVYLAEEIEREKPDLIVYEHFMIHIKILKKYYDKLYEMGKRSKNMKFRPTKPFPPCVPVQPSFSMENSIYPNSFEKRFTPKPQIQLSSVPSLLFLLVHILKLCFKYGINIFPLCNPLDFKVRPERDLFQLTTVFPDLQPRAHLFDEKLYKFIGSTSINFSNSKFIAQTSNQLVSNMLSDFPIRDLNAEPFDLNRSKSDLKLIYISLGTMVNFNVSVYKKLIDALKTFDDEAISKSENVLKFKNMRVIVSVGEFSYKIFEELIANEGYCVPENILLVKSAPQVEILQRASLFITHSGMNSTSEAVHYGVPMLSVPIMADQHLVSYRIIDELGFGMKIDYLTFKVEEVRQKIYKILSHSSYYERIGRYAKISHQFNGRKIAADLIIQYLNERRKRIE